MLTDVISEKFPSETNLAMFQPADMHTALVLLLAGMFPNAAAFPSTSHGVLEEAAIT